MKKENRNIKKGGMKIKVSSDLDGLIKIREVQKFHLKIMNRYVFVMKKLYAFQLIHMKNTLLRESNRRPANHYFNIVNIYKSYKNLYSSEKYVLWYHKELAGLMDKGNRSLEKNLKVSTPVKVAAAIDEKLQWQSSVFDKYSRLERIKLQTTLQKIFSENEIRSSEIKSSFENAFILKNKRGLRKNSPIGENILHIASARSLREFAFQSKTYENAFKIFNNAVQKIHVKNEKFLYDLNQKFHFTIDSTSPAHNEGVIDLQNERISQKEKAVGEDRVQDLLQHKKLPVDMGISTASWTQNVKSMYRKIISREDHHRRRLSGRRIMPMKPVFASAPVHSTILNRNVDRAMDQDVGAVRGNHHQALQALKATNSALVYTDKSRSSLNDKPSVVQDEVITTKREYTRNFSENIKENHIKEFVTREVREAVKKVGFEKFESRLYDLFEEKLSIEMERRG